ncbi:hypothetical protein ABID16_000571 [Rhizobium aquaticum]|uniref:Uncharacterized protein n=1 Tax=Rhizobium aquaticum TaxID=1549636 RepID=A0ABV2IVW4_9HYPH
MNSTYPDMRLRIWFKPAGVLSGTMGYRHHV